jgi:hypothetical protein
MGAEGDIYAYLAVRHFGVQIYSSVLGLMTSVLGIATSVGSVILSITLERTEFDRLSDASHLALEHRGGRCARRAIRWLITGTFTQSSSVLRPIFGPRSCTRAAAASPFCTQRPGTSTIDVWHRAQTIRRCP